MSSCFELLWSYAVSLGYGLTYHQLNTIIKVSACESLHIAAFQRVTQLTQEC